jgi:hypothetical protein
LDQYPADNLEPFFILILTREYGLWKIARLDLLRRRFDRSGFTVTGKRVSRSKAA